MYGVTGYPATHQRMLRWGLLRLSGGPISTSAARSPLDAGTRLIRIYLLPMYAYLHEDDSAA